jgi:hypothetical protein
MPFPRSASRLLVASGLGIPKEFTGGWMGTFRLRWGVLTVVTAVFGFLGGCSSGNTSYNSTPTATTVIPSNVTAGSQSFTLFITGTGFIDSNQGASFAYWNNSPRSTTLNTLTSQLEVTIPASDVVTPGIVQITVANPPPGGGPFIGVNFHRRSASKRWSYNFSSFAHERGLRGTGLHVNCEWRELCGKRRGHVE